MAQEDDLRALAKIIDFFRATAVILLILHCYWYCYEAFHQLGLHNEIVNDLITYISKTGLFNNFTLNKTYCFGMIVLACLGMKGVKSEKITINRIGIVGIMGILLFFCNSWLLTGSDDTLRNALWYIGTTTTGFILLLTAGTWISRVLRNNLMTDVFNEENESFMQETRLMENEYSVNLPTKFYYQKKWHAGWINIINPFRATIVLGTPGSGKSYAIVNQMIKQHIEKGYALFVYDFKYPDLSTITYNHLLNHLDGYKIKPKFYVINFDNPKHSHRCNPINPEFMTDISDAYESAYTIMLNLNKTWV